MWLTCPAQWKPGSQTGAHTLLWCCCFLEFEACCSPAADCWFHPHVLLSTSLNKTLNPKFELLWTKASNKYDSVSLWTTGHRSDCCSQQPGCFCSCEATSFQCPQLGSERTGRTCISIYYDYKQYRVWPPPPLCQQKLGDSYRGFCCWGGKAGNRVVAP